MLRIVKARDMQTIDRQATEQYGIPGHKLMEQAGMHLAGHVMDMLGVKSQARVTVLVGGGKNGGDGLVCARYLARAGVKPVVLVLAEKIAPETYENLQRLASENIPHRQCSGELPATFADAIGRADVVVDAMLGIGLSGEVREPYAAAIHRVNQSAAMVIAADVPSGLDADSGRPGEATVRADLTVTFGLPKPGLLATSACGHVGRLVVETIGFPPELLNAAPDEPEQYVHPQSVAALLPRRPVSAHKRSAGKVLVIGGSAQYHGAPLLAVLGAMRSGAGYVAVAYPRSLDAAIRSHAVEAICLPLADQGKGVLSPSALEPLLAMAADYDSVVLGPGLGNGLAAKNLVKKLVPKLQGPKILVVDADGFHGLAELDGMPHRKNSPALVITPHEGEAGRLLGITAGDVGNERAQTTRALAKKVSGLALLKGSHTLVTGKGLPLYTCCAGTQGLATAGSGDVLSGVIAGLGAQGMPLPSAVLAAVMLHNLAAGTAAQDLWGQGMLARDIAEALPRAFAQLRKTPARADWA